MQAAILAAVKEERENMEKCHSEEKAAWQAERNKDREKIAKAIEDSMQELKESYQVGSFVFAICKFDCIKVGGNGV